MPHKIKTNQIIINSQASLNPKSKLTKLLEDMEMLPAINENFDMDSLIGLPVTVLVEKENVNFFRLKFTGSLPVTVLVEKVMKNGFQYTNVNRIKKRI